MIIQYSQCQSAQLVQSARSITIYREGLDLTLSILPSLQGRISQCTPWGRIDDEYGRTRELLGDPPPLPLRFPSTLKMSLGLRPCDISRVSGNLFGFGDGFPDTSIVLMEHGYSPQSLVQDRLQSM